MAEFQEVMRQWRRMCAAFKECEECPQYREYQCYNTVKRVFQCGDIESLENNVMKWAAEHPEPVYPTWEEWLITQGVIKENPTGGVGWPMPKLVERIPADIAQKLGIEPKGDV